MNSKKTLSLCMITKNEEQFIDKSLKSIQDIVDEIIIVDTGSTDQTISIARNFGASIFRYTWDHHFSKARNFCIQQATSDWILLLDADEILEEKDQQKILNFIETTPLDGCHFKVYNYMDENNYTLFTVHDAFRLLKNNGQYTFNGAIHEQITAINGETDSSRFGAENIVLHHYGYLRSVSMLKDKRSRNIKILLSELEKDPDNPFYLFNLGNEYMAASQLDKAIQTYKASLHYSKKVSAFTLHLYQRLALCLYDTGNFHEALTLIQKGLSLFPLCIDLLYLNGLLHARFHHYSLAIQSFISCIDSHTKESKVILVNGVDSYKSYLELGKIYTTLKDYDQAILYYTKTLEANNTVYQCLYALGNLFNKKYTDSQNVCFQLGKYFSSLNHLDNLYVYIDILLTEKLYNETSPFILHLENETIESVEKNFLLGKFYFFTKNYSNAKSYFYQVLTESSLSTLFPSSATESLLFLFSLALIGDEKSIIPILPLLERIKTPALRNVCLQFEEIYKGGQTCYLEIESDCDLYLKYSLSVLEKLLSTHELELFEKFLSILNYIPSKKVLLALADLYANHSLKDMCIETILRSIKELDTIDKESAYLLADLL